MTNLNEQESQETSTTVAGRLDLLVMCRTAFFEYFYQVKWCAMQTKKLKCKTKGHEFVEARQYLLPARQCKRCGLHQVRLPEIGCNNPGWTDSLTDT